MPNEPMYLTPENAAIIASLPIIEVAEVVLPVEQVAHLKIGMDFTIKAGTQIAEHVIWGKEDLADGTVRLRLRREKRMGT